MDVQRWLSERPEIEEFALPPISPDLSAIENVWARLKGRTRELIADRPPRNRDELWNHVLDAWKEIIDSMTRRAEAVRETEGYWTKY